MPFISSVAARQSGLLFPNAAKLPTPTFGASSGASNGYTFSISNYDSTITYSFSVSNGGSASQIGGLVTIVGLGNGVTATCTVTVNKNGWLTNSSSTTGVSFSQLAAPTFSASTATAGGWTATITNFNAANTYSLSTTAGSASQASGTITQSGLGNNVSSTVTVTVSRSGFVSNSATVSGTSQSKLATPTLSAATSAAGGFSFTIDNYDAANTYTLSTTAGSVSRSSSTVTQSGLGNNASATVSVTASRSGFVNSDTATRAGTSFSQLATPTFGSYAAGADPGRFKFRVSIANYDAANTYSVSVSAGSFTRSGAAITVTGLSDSQSSTVYVTASRSGFVTSDQAAQAFSAPGAPCPAYTWTGAQYIYDGFGCSACCYWRGYCDGNYGEVILFYSGPCGYPGVYCAGCT